MVPTAHGNEYCPDCGGKLLYNGQGLVCIRCPFAVAKPDSERSIPAARSTPKPRPEGQSSEEE